MTSRRGVSEADKRMVDKMNAHGREHRDVAMESTEVQNISMMEPFTSGRIKDILESLDRLWAKY